jgi:hypothetical protein
VDLKGDALTYQAGSWSRPDDIDPGVPLESVSCSSETSCIAADFTSAFRWLPPTETAITAVTRHPVAGRPLAVRVQVRGLTRTARSTTPTGKVTVTDGRRRCLAVLRGSHGIATGACSLSETRAGRYLLKARYPGNKRFGSSATHRPTPITVARGGSANPGDRAGARATLRSCRPRSVATVV